jgi:hypothetical protein
VRCRVKSMTGNPTMDAMLEDLMGPREQVSQGGRTRAVRWQNFDTWASQLTDKTGACAPACSGLHRLREDHP